MGCGTLGLVFAGGGAKGAYQIGAWEAMRDYSVNGHPLTDFVAKVSGTSIGALNAALFIQGNLEQAREIWESIQEDQIFIIRGTKEFQNLLQSLLDIFRKHPTSAESQSAGDLSLEMAVTGITGACRNYQHKKSHKNYTALVSNCVSMILALGLTGSASAISVPLVVPMAITFVGFLIRKRPTKDELFAVLRRLKQISSFAFLNEDGVQKVIHEALSLDMVSQSNIDSYATCTDLENNTGVSFLLNGRSQEEIEHILLASAAYPFAFPDQIIDGVRYCDGGFIPENNVPIDALLSADTDRCCSLIIAILLDSELPLEKKYPEVLFLTPSINLGGPKSTFDFKSQHIMGRIEQGRKEMGNFLKSNRAKIEEKLSDEHC